MQSRADGRSADALRSTEAKLAVQKYPEGSVLYASGDTRVLLAVSVQDGVGEWMAGKGRGWVTAEYAMHPRANAERNNRDGRRGPIDGRSQEIQRLIGRSLRAAVNLDRLGERTLTVDCDVLDADGGTRTAAITGGFIALALALDKLRARGLVPPGVLRAPVAAVSTGLWEGHPVLDLCFAEDREAAVDLNVVGTGTGELVEVQGTAEPHPVPQGEFHALVTLGLAGVQRLVELQIETLSQAGIDVRRLQG